ncbi:MAG: aldo/keto reductase [Oscillospiraceae bacterium]|nr:aldo/keto reductase [Oscillospiraceae bacterium]
MKKVPLGSSGLQMPAVIIGCMRLGELSTPELTHYIHTAMEAGANFFDHADIYGGGICEEHFGAALPATSH